MTQDKCLGNCVCLPLLYTNLHSCVSLGFQEFLPFPVPWGCSDPLLQLVSWGCSDPSLQLP